MIILVETRDNVDAINKSMSLAKSVSAGGSASVLIAAKARSIFFSLKDREDRAKSMQNGSASHSFEALRESSALPARNWRRTRKTGLHAVAIPRHPTMTLLARVLDRSDEAESRPFVIGYSLFTL